MVWGHIMSRELTHAFPHQQVRTKTGLRRHFVMGNMPRAKVITTTRMFTAPLARTLDKAMTLARVPTRFS